MRPTEPGPPQHLGDLISGLIDGELTADERTPALAHLESCATCRAEYDATAALAAALEALPPVEPPASALAHFRPKPERRRRPVLAGLAVVGMVALAVGVGGQVPAGAVTPPVEDMIDRHEDQAVPAHGFDPMAEAEMKAPYGAPPEMGEMDRDSVFHRGDLVQVRYGGTGDQGVSVFEQAGHLDTATLPDGMQHTDDDAWVLEVADIHAVVVERGRIVYTVVGSAPMPEVMAVVHDLPPTGGDSLLDRVRDASVEVVWSFGLGD